MNELRLRNRQRVRAVDLRLLRRLTLALLQDFLDWRRFALGLHLVAAPEMAVLNQRFLRHAGPTDVLAFDHSHVLTLRQPGQSSIPANPGAAPSGDWNGPPEHYGEIFICTDLAVAQARRFRTSWQEELVRYLVHGLLHLQGHQDGQATARRKMKREEVRLLKLLGRRFALRQLARADCQRSLSTSKTKTVCL